MNAIFLNVYQKDLALTIGDRTRKIISLRVKSRLSSRTGSLALRQLNPIHKKEP